MVIAGSEDELAEIPQVISWGTKEGTSNKFVWLTGARAITRAIRRIESMEFIHGDGLKNTGNSLSLWGYEYVDWVFAVDWGDLQVFGLKGVYLEPQISIWVHYRLFRFQMFNISISTNFKPFSFHYSYPKLVSNLPFHFEAYLFTRKLRLCVWFSSEIFIISSESLLILGGVNTGIDNLLKINWIALKLFEPDSLQPIPEIYTNCMVDCCSTSLIET